MLDYLTYDFQSILDQASFVMNRSEKFENIKIREHRAIGAAFTARIEPRRQRGA